MKITSFLLLVITFLHCKSASECIKLEKADYEENAQSERDYKQGNIEKAINKTNQIILSNPNNYIAHSNRGVFRFKQCLKEKRITENDKMNIYSDLNKSINICPEYSTAYENIIQIATEIKDYDVLIEIIKRYNQRFKLNSDLLVRLGDSCYERGKFDEAIDYSNQAINTEPIKAFAYVIRGKCKVKSGKLVAAMEDFNKAIELDSTICLAYHERGNCNKMLNRIKEAENDFFHALRINSSRVEPYFLLGTIRIEQGDTTAGCVFYNKALDLSLKDENLAPNSNRKTIEDGVNKYCK